MSIRPIDSAGIAPRNNKLDLHNQPLSKLEAEPTTTTTTTGLLEFAPIDTVKNDTPDLDTQDHQERAHGVLRLLESGHFKGVADVRLRINFHEALTAQTESSTRPIIEKGLDDLASTVGDNLTSLMADLGLDGESLGAVETLLADFVNAVDATRNGSTDVESISTAVESAFDGLVSQLRDALSAPADETEELDVSSTGLDQGVATDPTDQATVDGLTALTAGSLVGADALMTAEVSDTAVVSRGTKLSSDEVEVTPQTGESVDEPTLTLDAALSELSDLFHQALEDFIASLDATFSSLEPAPYEGNGIAYDKFLAQYNALYDGSLTLNERA